MEAWYNATEMKYISSCLYRRYFEKMTFEQIAEKLHLSNKRVYQLHKIALKELDCELDKIRKS